MYLDCETLDDALRELYPPLLAQSAVVDTSRSPTRELIGVLIKIQKPRARLSRTEARGKPFSALGELLWYLTRDNQLAFILPYIPRYEEESEDHLTVHGGYGRRLFNQRGENQIENVLALLRETPSSRRAVIQLFDAEDISSARTRRHPEIPCTTTLQLLIRDGLMHMVTTMRSNDAYVGLPHDVFCFTMLQEIIARSVERELGSYSHFVGSMHLYEKDRDDAQRYVEEGVQPRIEMPAMPSGDPWPPIGRLLEAERRIRNAEDLDADNWGVAPYWADLIRLLQIFFATGDEAQIDCLKLAMTYSRYRPFIDSRRSMRPLTPRVPTQPSLL
jgi:thymidylate synthase